MAIERIRQPYELLVRFNGDGTVRGAHVQSLEVITEAGVTLAESVSTALPVADAAAAGFPVQAAIDFLRAALPA